MWTVNEAFPQMRSQLHQEVLRSSSVDVLVRRRAPFRPPCSCSTQDVAEVEDENHLYINPFTAHESGPLHAHLLVAR